MNKRIALLLILALPLFAAVPLRAEECSGLTVGSTDDWFPMCVINKDTGRAEGIANDFARHVAEQLQLPVNIVADVPWKRMLHYVETGRFDCVAAIYWTGERAGKYVYTAPFAFNEARVFVRKGAEFAFTSFADLKGKVGSIPAGGSFGEAFDTYARENDLALVGVQDKDQMVAMVLAGRADYFIQDLMDATIYLMEHDLDQAVVALPRPVSTTGVHMAFSPNSPCAALVPEVNAIIAKALQDGTLDRIIKNNLPQ